MQNKETDAHAKQDRSSAGSFPSRKSLRLFFLRLPEVTACGLSLSSNAQHILESDWQSPPWGSQTHIWGLASSALSHPLTHFRLLSYARNVLKSFIYKRPSFPVSSLLQIYFFPHSNTVILVESLAMRPTRILSISHLTPVMSSTPGWCFWKWISLLKVYSCPLFENSGDKNRILFRKKAEPKKEGRKKRGIKEGGRERGKEGERKNEKKSKWKKCGQNPVVPTIS